MKKKLFCILLSLCMLLCFMPQAAWADPVTGIKYLDWDADLKTLVEQTLTSTYATVTASDTEWISQTNDWYVVEGAVTINQRVTVTGNVNLLLKDNCNLTVNGGINVSGGNSLTIYAQSNDDSTMGKLEADAEYNENCAGIGGDNNGSSTGESGTITINGGKITAKGGESGAGIGCGSNKSYDSRTDIKITNGTITINGGDITAEGGKDAAGIGGGKNGNGSYITINGGKVGVTGGSDGAGIGGGYFGKGTNIIVNDGEVKASGGYCGAGIGGGSGGNGENIEISGGKVTSLAAGGAGIGGGKGGNGTNITISGGTVISESGSDGGAGIGGGQGANGTNITISGGTVTATAIGDAAGIGGGKAYSGLNNTGNGTKITISGGTVTARCLAVGGAGIGGGREGTGSNITISGSVILNVQGGKADGNSCGTGAAIGNGGSQDSAGTEAINGAEVLPNTDGLTGNWSIKYYNPGDRTGYNEDLSSATPIKTFAFLVTFSSAKGTLEHNTIAAESGKTISEPTAPTVAGYTLEGWYKESNYTTKFDFNTDTITANTTLYAKWIENTGYTVKFDTGDGASTIADKTVTWTGAILSGVNDPTKAGYTFNGWKYGTTSVAKPSEGVLGTSYSILVPNDDIASKEITLVAQWEDTTAPVISGIENGKTYYVGQEFTATDVNTVTVTINGTAATPTEGKYKLTTTGENVVVATDSANNATTLTVTVSRKYGGGSSKTQTATDEQKQAELEKAAAEKKAAEIAEVKTTTAGLDSLKARSSRTAKGNVKVVAKLSSTEKAKIAEFKELGYTVKYRFYRGAKKSSGYKAMLTGTTGIYYNTSGKDGTRYYYKAQIRVYDADGTLIAKTELKDCKYATRIF